ncbi:signal peptidase I [Bacteriovoracaceae bacterium]|nr:signal peptidase I [Bacteriovoracaceae bacterium]
MNEQTTSTPKDKELSKSQKIKKEIISIIGIIIMVFAFRSTFFEPFKIPTGSMIPTLLIGDFILVNKFAYGFKVPFTEWFSESKYITEFTPPERGDIVVFKYPRDPSLNFIKRVIGIPGDTIEVINKVVYVNDQPIEGLPVDGAQFDKNKEERNMFNSYDYYKAKHGEANFVYRLRPDTMHASTYDRRTVPKDKLLVMGDNRDNSSDSRSWGFVPFENVKGRAVLVWFGLSVSHPWAIPGTTFKFRPWRIGKYIE